MTRCGLEVRRISALSLLAVALCAGCLNAGPQVQSVEASAASGSHAKTSEEKLSGTGGMPEATTIGASQIEGDLAGATDASVIPFVAKSQASGGSGYDADTVLAVRYEVNESYERAVIDLGSGFEPAGPVPEWNLVSQEGKGLLRVTLPSASATCVSDGEFGDGLLESFHVVRAPEGGMFMDIFTRETFLYRVVELEDPARLVVDFEPKGDLKAPLPAEGGDTVLVEPRPHASISDPLTVNGYSRNSEAANAITLIDSNGNILVRRIVLGNDRGHHTWGYFEATLDLPSLPKKGLLKVGTENGRDGSFEGVEIPVRTR
jgi:Immunoglobulin-like domain of bacterial spore germination